ncbi:MAG: hypothetical protein D4R44_04095, partial [Actinobacteria bacterium]
REAASRCGAVRAAVALSAVGPCDGAVGVRRSADGAAGPGGVERVFVGALVWHGDGGVGGVASAVRGGATEGVEGVSRVVTGGEAGEFAGGASRVSDDGAVVTEASQPRRSLAHCELWRVTCEDEGGRMILRLRMEMEIDTTAHSMRVIEQKVVDGMPTAQMAERLTGVCGWGPCSQPIRMRQDGRMPKFCGRVCYGLSRRNPNFIEHRPDRRPVVDAVTGVIRQLPPPPAPSAPIDHSQFHFPSR